jgi:hypothetical protein
MDVVNSISKIESKTGSDSLTVIHKQYCKYLDKLIESDLYFYKCGINYGHYKKITSCDPILKGSCSICLGEYKVGTYKRRLSCSHEFHKKCIDRWFKIRESHALTCPICRDLHKISKLNKKVKKVKSKK